MFYETTSVSKWIGKILSLQRVSSSKHSGSSSIAVEFIRKALSMHSLRAIYRYLFGCIQSKMKQFFYDGEEKGECEEFSSLSLVFNW